MINSPLLLGDEGGYQISRSVRTRSSASAYFTRTPPSGSGGSAYTISMWVKRGTLGTVQALCSANYTNTVFFDVIFNTGNTLEIYLDAGAGSTGFISTSVYRDTSAWYHIMIVGDHTNATAANRLKIFVNGVAAPGTYTYPSTGFSTSWNIGTRVHGIGVRPNATYQWYFDGYIAEFYSVDGQALTPSSFGETNAITGVWQPKKYAGTYGTNGFYLNFSDNSGATATTIGKDNSGNSNNWTPNNISVTAGVTYDSMLDVPTPYDDGTVYGRGNYCVLNPLDNYGVTITNANLTLSAGGGNTWIDSTLALPSTGKLYWEYTCQNTSGANRRDCVGFAVQSLAKTGFFGGSSSTGGYMALDGSMQGFGGTAGPTWNNTDVIGVIVDCATGKVWYSKNGTLIYGDPVAGTGQSFTLASPVTQFVPAFGPYSNAGGFGIAGSVNFGQRPFAYTPPTGFKALNTQNLPDATIKKGNLYFDATTYTGTGASQNITNGGFQPDLVWFKVRNTTYSHVLLDALRNSGANALLSDSTGAELANYANGQITAFNSNGVTINSGVAINENTRPYVGWQWNAGGSTVTNTSGSISSQVRANPTAGFSVVTYTGTLANATVGHGLGVAPQMIIVKSRSVVQDWGVYHIGLTSAAYWIQLNTTSAQINTATVWNSTAPTSTVFSLGAAGVGNQNSGMVAYCFAAVAGYSAFGSYTGNGSADGPFVYLGFRPRFVMIRNPAIAANWLMFDSSRNTYNQVINFIFANTSDAEQTSAGSVALDFLSNGFKIRQTSGNINASGNTLIYMAFAENPFKLALAE